jgi:hypothetical protein
MTCSEFQKDLPDSMDRGRSGPQQTHLNSCSECSALVSDLDFISRHAQILGSSTEPSPAVWNSIEIALRAEGLIRPSSRDAIAVVPSPAWKSRWNFRWLAPVAAAVVIAGGVVLYQQAPNHSQMANQPGLASEPGITTTATRQIAPLRATPAAAVEINGEGDDSQLLQLVSTRAPAMRSAYEADLKNVNAYIRDAEESAQSNPNDDEVQQSLMDAYEQRAMVYEMAEDRSLP